MTHPYDAIGDMQAEIKRLTAENAERRELLREAREHMGFWSNARDGHTELLAQIDRALGTQEGPR